MNQQFDQKTIETLKAARNQVMQADPIPEQARYGAGKSGGESTNVNRGQNPSPKQPHNKFAEEFVQKLASIEQEKTAVDEEMAKVEKLWASLVDKKKQLEARRNELLKLQDKLKELDKEMSNALKVQPL